MVGAECGADWNANVDGDTAWQDPHPQSKSWCASEAAEIVACSVEALPEAVNMDASAAPPPEPHVMTVDSDPSAASSRGSKPLHPMHQTVMTAVIARRVRRRVEGRRIMKGTSFRDGAHLADNAGARLPPREAVS